MDGDWEADADAGVVRAVAVPAGAAGAGAGAGAGGAGGGEAEQQQQQQQQQRAWALAYVGPRADAACSKTCFADALTCPPSNEDARAHAGTGTSGWRPCRSSWTTRRGRSMSHRYAAKSLDDAEGPEEEGGQGRWARQSESERARRRAGRHGTPPFSSFFFGRERARARQTKSGPTWHAALPKFLRRPFVGPRVSPPNSLTLSSTLPCLVLSFTRSAS